MDILQAIRERHSVRSYLDISIEEEKLNELKREIEICNEESGLNIQLITDEEDAFSGFVAKYSRFKNVKNYIAMVGEDSNSLNETVGYFGERLVLKAQMLGLNTCWVGLKLITKYGKCVVNDGEKMVCLITLGYGETQGKQSRGKTFEKVSKFKGNAPEWFKRGVEYALLAPTAINQQKFMFVLEPNNIVRAEITGGVMSDVDLGIVKYHFAVGAGSENFMFWEKSIDGSTASELLILNCIVYTLEFGLQEKSKDFIDNTVYEWSKGFKYSLLESGETPGGIGEKEFSNVISTIQKHRDFFDEVKIVDIENSQSGNPDGTMNVVNVTFMYRDNLIIVYKGTSGVMEWADNVKGMYDDAPDTPQQKEALKYYDEIIKKFSGQFKNIYVSGHSKGGNKTQYICVNRGEDDRFKMAYSFDGNGFNLRFLEENKEKIKRVRKKIVSVSNEFDFVNILSNRIAGENIYIKSNTSVGDGSKVEEKMNHHFGGWHSPYSMFIVDEENSELKLNKKVPQSDLMYELEDLFKYYEENMTLEDRKYCYETIALEMKKRASEGYDEEIPTPEGFVSRFSSLTISRIKDRKSLNFIDYLKLMSPVFKDISSILIKGNID